MQNLDKICAECQFCHNLACIALQIPDEITNALGPIKDNEEAVRAYGIHLGTEMCKKILANGINTLHLYTLNMEKSALAIIMVGIFFSIAMIKVVLFTSSLTKLAFSESWINRRV